MSDTYSKALALIDEAHRKDPRVVVVDGAPTPYEMIYADKMTKYLEKRSESPSKVLRLAIRAQHLQRWEVPRDSYPMTKLGYLSWRTALKKRQAQLAKEICITAGMKDEEAQRVGQLVSKDSLRSGDEESQVLEDVACLVFLDDQFEEFKNSQDEEKMITILKKTWAKMSARGHELALEIPLSDEGRLLVAKALQG